MHENPREKHEIKDDDGYYGSCCRNRVSTLVKDMESGANALHNFGALLLWDVKLGKEHGETSLLNLELKVMTCSEEDTINVSLMFHGALDACVDARVEDLGFEDSNRRMDL